MLWLFTGKTRTRSVPDGATMREHCPSCGRTSTFHEVEVTTSGGVFFIDLLSDTSRAWRCDRCGDVFDQRDEPAKAPPPKPRDLLETLESDRARRESDRARRDAQVEDELAALKKRLGN